MLTTLSLQSPVSCQCFPVCETCLVTAYVTRNHRRTNIEVGETLTRMIFRESIPNTLSAAGVGVIQVLS